MTKLKKVTRTKNVVLINGKKCLTKGSPGSKQKGRYGPWHTEFYFPMEKNCDMATDNDNCLQQHVAYHNVKHKLLDFIDITNIKVNEKDGTSSYKFNCRNGFGENSKKYFRNGEKGTLCHMCHNIPIQET